MVMDFITIMILSLVLEIIMFFVMMLQLFIIKIKSLFATQGVTFLIMIFKKAMIFIIDLLAAFLISIGCDYDPDKVDTQEGRNGLASLGGIENSSEIKEVYHATAGFWTRDPEYYYAFYAPPHIVDEIVKNCNLSETDEKDASSTTLPEWWNAEIREKSKCYALDNEELRGIWKLWYDPESQYAQIMILYY